VVAPGTGLGEAFLLRAGSAYIACASEGGHADFAPADTLQAGLLAQLAGRFGHVSYERVCSGSGIPHLYAYLRDSGHAPEAPGFAAMLAAAADATPLIVRAAIERPDANPLALAAIDLFVAILGAEAGNLALKLLATGGVYLAGGMPPRVLPRLEEGRFMRAFAAKGRFAPWLSAIPVHVVLTEAALIGAAQYGLDLLAGPSPC
jgi:glucokinase